MEQKWIPKTTSARNVRTSPFDAPSVTMLSEVSLLFVTTVSMGDMSSISRAGLQSKKYARRDAAAFAPSLQHKHQSLKLMLAFNLETDVKKA